MSGKTGMDQQVEMIELSFRDEFVATLHVIKGEDIVKGELKFHLSAYIKECDSAIACVWSWDEEELKRRMTSMYNACREFSKDEWGLDLPVITGYNLIYFEDSEEWLGNKE